MTVMMMMMLMTMLGYLVLVAGGGAGGGAGVLYDDVGDDPNASATYAGTMKTCGPRTLFTSTHGLSLSPSLSL